MKTTRIYASVVGDDRDRDQYQWPELFLGLWGLNQVSSLQIASQDARQSPFKFKNDIKKYYAFTT